MMMDEKWIEANGNEPEPHRDGRNGMLQDATYRDGRNGTLQDATCTEEQEEPEEEPELEVAISPVAKLVQDVARGVPEEATHAVLQKHDGRRFADTRVFGARIWPLALLPSFDGEVLRAGRYRFRWVTIDSHNRQVMAGFSRQWAIPEKPRGSSNTPRMDPTVTPARMAKNGESLQDLLGGMGQLLELVSGLSARSATPIVTQMAQVHERAMREAEAAHERAMRNQEAFYQASLERDRQWTQTLMSAAKQQQTAAREEIRELSERLEEGDGGEEEAGAGWPDVLLAVLEHGPGLVEQIRGGVKGVKEKGEG